MTIEIYASDCACCCQKVFGLKDEAMACPHCHRSTTVAAVDGIYATYLVLIDPINGVPALVKA